MNLNFTLETVSQVKTGLGHERQILHCDSCGGELSIAPGSTTTCPFCASNQVNVTKSLEETLRPRYLIPFKITQEQAAVLAGEWLGKGTSQRAQSYRHSPLSSTALDLLMHHKCPMGSTGGL